MSGSFGSPYRSPCYGWPAAPRNWIGCYNHARAAENGLLAYVNTTEPTDLLDHFPTLAEIAANTFEQSGTVNFAVCHKLGFKATQAKKAWHGRLPFDVCTTAPDCAYGVKYRTVTRTAYVKYQYVSNYDPYTLVTEYEATIIRNDTVNKDSGIISETGSGNTVYDPAWLVNFLGDSGSNSANALHLFSGATCITSAVADALIATALSNGFICTVTARSADRFTCSMVFDWEPGNPYSWSDSRKITVNLDIQLSDPYSAEDFRADYNELLSTWNHGSDTIYPWRTDEHCSVAPLVTRNEVTAAVNPDNPHSDLGWEDTANIALYDGSIVGAPALTGVDKCFDFRRKQWSWDSYTSTLNIDGYGMWNTGKYSYLPRNATQWTDDIDSQSMRAGAYQIYTASSGVMFAQKWAEAFVRRPSQDFFRPCGIDRFAIDYSKKACITSDNGVTYQLDADMTAPWDFDTGVLFYLHDGTNYSIVTITNLTATSVDVAAQISENDPLITDRPTYIIAPLRFQTAFPICGRIQIASATNETGPSVHFTLSESAPFLKVGDSVSFEGIPGLTGGNVITDITGGVYTIAATMSTSPYDASAGIGYVSSAGAPAYYWHDSGSKGDFVTISRLYNSRTYGEWLRLGSIGTPPAQYTDTITPSCYSMTPCAPVCVYWSPAGQDTGLPGTNQGWPDTFSGDCYAFQWQAVAHQHMPDLLWQAPALPCDPEFIGTWLEDDGSCELDDEGVIKYYAQRPWVEARTTLPAGAPALTLGISYDIAFPTYTVPDMPGPDDGHVDAAEYATAWGIWLREMSVAPSCRFYATYRANLI